MLAVVAVSLMVTGMLSSAWLVGQDDYSGYRVGLWRVQQCLGSSCTSIDLDTYPDDHTDAEHLDTLAGSSWRAAGYVTLGLGVLSVLTLVGILLDRMRAGATVADAMSGRRPPVRRSRLPRLCVIAHVLAIVATVALVVVLPPEHFVATTAAVGGQAFTCFLIGAVVGLGTALYLERGTRPSGLDREPHPDAAAQPMRDA